MSPSALDVIKPAFEHMSQQLFRPFRWSQWWRLAVTGLLAGELSGAGGLGFRFPAGLPQRGGSSAFLIQANFTRNVALITALAFVALILVVAYMYISSRMRFVLFDSIVSKECHIRRYWAAHDEAGLRYFGFQLLFTLTNIIIIVSLIAAAFGVAFAFGWLRNPGQHVLPLVLGGMIGVAVLVIYAICAAVFMVFTRDFVIPQMALENIGIVEGWNRLWFRIDTEKAGYAAYVGLKILLSIAAGIALGIGFLIVAVVWLIPVGAIALIGFLAARVLGLVWNVATIAIVVAAGLVALLILLAAVVLISVPIIVFFPAYSIHFFATRYTNLHAALYPRPST